MESLTDSALLPAGPAWPGQLASPAELCWYWSAMDAHHSTPTDSPLHHNNRCERCEALV